MTSQNTLDSSASCNSSLDVQRMLQIRVARPCSWFAFGAKLTLAMVRKEVATQEVPQ